MNFLCATPEMYMQEEWTTIELGGHYFSEGEEIYSDWYEDAAKKYIKTHYIFSSYLKDGRTFIIFVQPIDAKGNHIGERKRVSATIELDIDTTILER